MGTNLARPFQVMEIRQLALRSLRRKRGSNATSILSKTKYTIEEYIELEKSSEEHYEYFDGEVFAMAGGNLEHAIIATNVAGAINNRLGDKNCRVINSDVRVKVPAVHLYRYPDVTVVCGEPITEKYLGQVMLVNPLLLVEVLSPRQKITTQTASSLSINPSQAFRNICSSRRISRTLNAMCGRRTFNGCAAISLDWTAQSH